MTVHNNNDLNYICSTKYYFIQINLDWLSRIQDNVYRWTVVSVS